MTISTATPAEVWEVLVGQQTPKEFIENGGDAKTYAETLPYNRPDRVVIAPAEQDKVGLVVGRRPGLVLRDLAGIVPIGYHPLLQIPIE